jgi:hypothetical protein
VSPPVARSGGGKARWVAGAVVVVLFLVYVGGQRGTITGGSGSGLGGVRQAGTESVSSTLMQLSGTGIKKSPKFTTSADWTIGYAFDCSSFGSAGNFAITVYSGDGSFEDVAVNELAAKGSCSSPEYNKPGEHYLEMNSECSRTVKVGG